MDYETGEYLDGHYEIRQKEYYNLKLKLGLKAIEEVQTLPLLASAYRVTVMTLVDMSVSSIYPEQVLARVRRYAKGRDLARQREILRRKDDGN